MASRISSSPDTVEIAGFRAVGMHAGLKGNGANDMALIASDRGCTAAGVFTTNLMKAAPVLLDIECLNRARHGYRAVVINTTCANACTGEHGIENARKMARLTAEALGCDETQVFVLSTGVIGTHLPMDKIAYGISLAVEALGSDWDAAARGIMTTDTKPKLASIKVNSGGGDYSIVGIAKGAGMIAPNMATMLGLIFTDAELSAEQAERFLKSACDKTFNRIVVDGDMSTNDTLLLLANGASGAAISPKDEAQFLDALYQVCLRLAQAIVRDGEGATKLITVHVIGAEDDAAARQIANVIATSPLVKTAAYGQDANWGRIIAAAGRAGVYFDPREVKLWLCDDQTVGSGLLLFENEMPTAYPESEASRIVSAQEYGISLRVGQGSGEAVVYTCDLSHDYVSINGHYRT